MTGRAKWDAWANAAKACEGSREVAERKYLEVATRLGWSPSVPSQPGPPSPSENNPSQVGQSRSNEGAKDDDDDDIWDKDPPGKGQDRGGFAVSVSSVATPADELGEGEGIHTFALSGDILRLRCILDSGDFNINALDDYGYAPLHLAADRGNLEIVKLLLEYHADPTIKDEDGYTPCDLAEEAGHKHIVDLLADVVKKT
jgi:hypothetical protein